MAKKAVVKKGIILTKSSGGISVHIHAGNGNKLAVMSGYNSVRNARNGILALQKALDEAMRLQWMETTGKYQQSHIVTDLTKLAKKK